MVDASPITPIGVVEPQRSTAKGAKLGGSGAGDTDRTDEVYSLSQEALKQYSEGPVGSKAAGNEEAVLTEEAAATNAARAPLY